MGGSCGFGQQGDKGHHSLGQKTEAAGSERKDKEIGCAHGDSEVLVGGSGTDGGESIEYLHLGLRSRST